MRHIPYDRFEPDQDWLKQSDELTKELIRLHESGDIEARNQFIDDHSAHWGQIKAWLLDISHGKCWFSEAKDTFSHYDVEHFRPKKKSKEEDGTEYDGYWWLAFDYKNFRLCGNVGNRKKGTFFPLKGGCVRSEFKNQCEEMEEPYLLDPTDIDDTILVAFDEEGLAIPAPGISKWSEQRVLYTIDRIKLNEHEPLAEARKEIWGIVNREINEFNSSRQRYAKNSNPALKIKMKHHLQRIRDLTREEEPFSSVAKWCVLFKNDPRLSCVIA